VLEADIERETLLKEERELLSRLEGKDEISAAENDMTISIEEKQKRLAQTKENDAKFGDDLKRLKEVYESLQLLSADTAQARAAMILSGLQFTHEMQLAPIRSLSGGWRMRVALAASLLIEPDLLLLGGYFTVPLSCAL
jgi:ATPase subunit of ABC transporter with duplicated ATPase domains